MSDNVLSAQSRFQINMRPTSAYTGPTNGITYGVPSERAASEYHGWDRSGQNFDVAPE